MDLDKTCTEVAHLHTELKDERYTSNTDYFSCPNCGEPCTNRDPCNSTCRRELLERQSRQWLRRNHVASTTPDTPQKVKRFLEYLEEVNRKANVLQVREPNWEPRSFSTTLCDRWLQSSLDYGGVIQK